MPYSGLVSDPMRPIRTIIFTDLDGTLLDHHNYSFAAAVPALQAVDERGIPLILTTSKTLAEVSAINHTLGNPQPAIVENGCALCFPLDRDYPFEIGKHERIDNYAVVRSSPDYATLHRFVERQRSLHQWRLQGFGDMDPGQVAASTGLDRQQAVKAKTRLCSEPFLWLDTDQNLKRFIAAAEDAGLRITRGGRFWHLMGQSSKAQALEAMRTLIVGEDTGATTVIALGDSENDRRMLQNADVAVVIRRHDGSHLDCHGREKTIFTQQQGPAGWNAAILQILKELGSDDPSSQGD